MVWYWYWYVIGMVWYGIVLVWYWYGMVWYWYGIGIGIGMVLILVCVITPPILPRLRRRPTEVTTDQDFGLVSSPTKPERDLSKLTLNNLNGMQNYFRVDISDQ
jgi:hypothetical protein